MRAFPRRSGRLLAGIDRTVTGLEARRHQAEVLGQLRVQRPEQIQISPVRTRADEAALPNPTNSRLLGSVRLFLASPVEMIRHDDLAALVRLDVQSACNRNRGARELIDETGAPNEQETS